MTLAVRNLSLTIGEFSLREISIEIAKGEYLVLMGQSGCGKTTLLKAIAGLVRTKNGVITISGQEVSHNEPSRRNIGYVPQAASLFPHLSVWENIAFGLRRDVRGPEAVKELINATASAVGVSHLLDRRVHGLSGGEAKRIAPARSLVLRPAVLLLDEPLSNLDAESRASLMSLLRGIAREFSTAMLHVTHDRDEAWRLGDKCAIMNDGAIIETGPPAELFSYPKTSFVATALGEADIIELDLDRRDGMLFVNLCGHNVLVTGSHGAGRGLVAFRPDGIVTVDKGLPATVTSVIRVGASFEIGLKLTCDIALRMRLPASANPPEIGQLLHVAFAVPPVALEYST